MFNIHYLHELYPLKCNITTNILYKKFHITTDLTAQTTSGFTIATHKPLLSLTYQDQQLIFE